MARKRFTTEQIIGMLREAEVRLSQGQSIGLICTVLCISEQIYYRWRRDYGGLKLDHGLLPRNDTSLIKRSRLFPTH
jgi:hypothetical protein